MASPSTVITLGYGSFGSVNLLPTLGYGIGAQVDVVYGPMFCVAQAYIPGAQQGQCYIPGLQAGEVKG